MILAAVDPEFLPFPASPNQRLQRLGESTRVVRLDAVRRFFALPPERTRRCDGWKPQFKGLDRLELDARPAPACERNDAGAFDEGARIRNAAQEL